MKKLIPLFVFLFIYHLKCIYELQFVNPFWWFQPFFESKSNRIQIMIAIWIYSIGLYCFYRLKDKTDKIICFFLGTFVSILLITLSNK